jgi:hypothetical protein
VFARSPPVVAVGVELLDDPEPELDVELLEDPQPPRRTSAAQAISVDRLLLIGSSTLA